jgi:putative transposase
MVRAGVVAHPGEWPYSGYNEIQTPRERYGLIDHERLTVLTGVKSRQEFIELHRSWIDEGLAKGNPFREGRWTESLAVGGEVFVKEIQKALGARAISRSIIEDGEQKQLRDLQQPYSAHFAPEKISLSQNIGLKWNIFPEI